MNKNMDFSALEWVRKEINASLQDAHKAFEAFVDAPEDTTKIQFCVTYLHQVWGSLQIMQLEGASLFAQEMELLAAAFLKQNVLGVEDAQAVLHQAFLKLPNYLETISAGGRDLPIVLLPILNDLRAARGEGFLSETNLFNPDIQSGNRVIEQQEPTQKTDLNNQILQLRKLYQKALLASIKEQSLEDGLIYMGKVLARLQRICGKSPVSQIWWIGGAMIDGLLNGSIQYSQSIKTLLIAIDRQIKYLGENLDKSLAQKVHQKLAKNLLYYVAQSEASTRRIHTVQKVYKLSIALPDEVRAEQKYNAKSGIVNDSVNAAVAILIDDINKVAEALDLMVRGGVNKDVQIKEVFSTLRVIANTLQILDLNDLKTIIENQEKILSETTIHGSQEARNLSGIASQLLLVETRLQEFVNNGLTQPELLGNNKNTHVISLDQLGSAQKLFLKEAALSIEEIKDSFGVLLSEDWDKKNLLSSIDQLKKLSSSFLLIPLPRVSQMFVKCHEYLENELVVRESCPDTHELEVFADVLSSIDYYIEKLYWDSRADDEALNIGCEQLEHLGYALSVEMTMDESQNEVCSDDASQLESSGEDSSVSPINVKSSVSPQDLGENNREEKSQSNSTHSGPFDIKTNQENVEEIDVQVEGLDDEQIETVEHLIESIDDGPTGRDSVKELSSDQQEIIDDDIIEIFIEEVEEVQEALHLHLPEWLVQADDQLALQEVRRAFHTLKGSGRMVGASEIAEMAWAIEQILNGVLDGTLVATEDLKRVVQLAVDALPDLLELFKQKKNEGTENSTLVTLYADQINKGKGVDFSSKDSAKLVIDASDTVKQGEITNQDLETTQQPTEDDGVVSDDSDMEILEIFIQEAEMHLKELRTYIQKCRNTESPWQITDELQSVLHTFKGCANIACVEPIASVVTKVENLVKELFQKDKKVSPEILKCIELSVNLSQQVIEEIPKVSPASLEQASSILLGIDELIVKLEHEDSLSKKQGGKQKRIEDLLSFNFNKVFESDDILTANFEDHDEKFFASDQKSNSDLSLLIEEYRQFGSHALNLEFYELNELCSVLIDALEISKKTKFTKPLHDNLVYASQSLSQSIDYFAAGQTVPDKQELILELRSKLESFTDQNINNNVAMPSVNLSTTSIESSSVADTEDASSLLAMGENVVKSRQDNEINEPPLQGEGIPVTSKTFHSKPESDQDAELLEIFLEEAGEIIESSLNALEGWSQDTRQQDLVKQLQRELHTLKGGARMAKVPEIGDFGHEMENLYEALVIGEMSADESILSFLFECHDRMNEMIHELQNEQHCSPASDLIYTIQIKLAESRGEAKNSHKGTKEIDGFDVLGKPILLEEGVDQEAISLFVQDTQALMEILEKALTSLIDEDNQDSINLINQRLSELISASTLSGLVNLAEYSIHFEEALHSCLANKITYEQLLAYFKPIKNFTASIYRSFDVVRLRDKQQAAPRQKPNNTARSSTEKSSEADTIRVSSELMDSLVNLAGETSINRGRLEAQLNDFSFSLEEMSITISRLQEQLRRLHLETEAQIVSHHELEKPFSTVSQENENFDPLELDKYSVIDQLSRSLSESASDLLDLQGTLTNKIRDAETLLLQQGRINLEVQESLTRSRMVPFSRLLPRLRRIVRQLSKELNKPAQLEILNAEGEFDRAMLEKLISPIEHMLRNALAHGIEPASQRKKLNKSLTAILSIDIAREGSNMVIFLKDDGAGINTKRVEEKAIESGLISNENSLSESEIHRLIFESGLSTASEINQVAGRGVGMDVVASELEELGGSVEIHSVANQGTTFSLRLPITVAVNRAFMVSSGEHVYAVPLDSVQGVVRISPYELEVYYRQEKPIFTYAGVDYNLQYLGEYIHGIKYPNLDGQQHPLPVLLLQSRDRAIAMQIDVLLGSREIVVKSVGAQLASVAGLSGATILGDGSVVIILDLHSLVRGAEAEKATRQKIRELNKITSAKHLKQVMVVDDSVTVRKVTSRLLERNNMEVILAKDGVDAITQLQDVHPDIMLLDIEMPRMDGFEVASLIRHDERLKDLPIIMITSRTGEKHKMRALEIGVNHYMGKPFQEVELLSLISKVLEGSSQE